MSADEPSCTTEHRSERMSFRWVIRDIDVFLRQQAGDAIYSSRFPTREQDAGEWYLRLSLRPAHGDEQYLSLYLFYMGARGVRAEAVFSIIGASEEVWNQQGTAFECFYPGSRSRGFDNFILRSALEGERRQALQEGDLVIRCTMTVVHGYVSAAGRRVNGYARIRERRLSEDLGSLLESGIYADVTVKAGAGSYLAHKAILASRSPVFQAMFSHQTQEAQRGEVVISDVDYDVFGELLCFIYTGHSPNLRAMAAPLLAAADKYCLLGLRDMCEEVLAECLDVDNAASLLILADRHSVPLLRLQAVDFIAAHRGEVMETHGWAALREHHVDLAEVILRTILRSSEDSGESSAKRNRT